MTVVRPQIRSRRLKIRHVTTYTYDRPVTKSSHRIHLRPIHDWKQSVNTYSLAVTPTPDGGGVMEFEDVFGNAAAMFDVTTPYSELTIHAESEVEVADLDPFDFAKTMKVRPAFPIVWMPWELKMLQPYLTPQELPDTQLKEIYDYATSVAQRNKGDILETLFDINLTLFREFKYVPGCTTFATTPFDVFLSKQGVCQDFANLFIAMARLLSLPARYVCGYIYTGNSSANGGSRAQSDASHAWVQIYIPGVGWKGFDPTNGIIPHLDHVRVGVGRNYRDTAPTTGTLYSPASESMSVDVEVTDLSAPGQAAPVHHGEQDVNAPAA
jgi:transglutaminase-like putative cysteine protease